MSYTSCFANCETNIPRTTVTAYGSTKQANSDRKPRCYYLHCKYFSSMREWQLASSILWGGGVLIATLLQPSCNWLCFNNTRLVYLVHRPFTFWVWSVTYLSTWLIVILSCIDQCLLSSLNPSLSVEVDLVREAVLIQTEAVRQESCLPFKWGRGL